MPNEGLQITNSGQICIAADYTICSAAAKPKLIAAFHAALAEFAPSGKSLLEEEDYSKIVTTNHFARESLARPVCEGVS